jgi:microcystin-dependent protein
MKTSAALLAMPLAAASASLALAAPQQAFDNQQPSLALSLVTPQFGSFPDGTASQTRGATLGFVYDFAGAFVPGDALATNGQSLSFSTNLPLAAVFNGVFGGGVNSFNLPNLVGRAIVGAGGGLNLGATVGSASVTLTASQVPAPGAAVAAQPYNTLQPSLALTPLIAVGAPFPNPTDKTMPATFLGQIANYAGSVNSSGSTVPGGWMPADGRLLPINQFSALFALIGTKYGGNGTTDFALPNLVGRIAIGADAADPIGSTRGSDAVLVTRSELPSPGQKPLSNDQPSLAVNYLIATAGITPTPFFNSLDGTTETLGQVVEFAGGRIPAGWALADGQLLPISENEGLFDLIGTTYGGDGVTDFALPDLDGRTVIGANIPEVSPFAQAAFATVSDGDSVGDVAGADDIFLTPGELPTPVPEPSTWALLTAGFFAMGLMFRRRQTQLSPVASAGVRADGSL